MPKPNVWNKKRRNSMHRIKIFSIAISAAALLTTAAAPLHAQSRLTLDEAVGLARENNRRVKLAQADLEIAGNDVTWGNAGLMPRVDLTAGYTGELNNARQTYASGDIVDGGAAGSSMISSGIGVGWTAFDGFRSGAVYDRLQQQETRAQAQVELTTEDVTAQVIRAYYDVVRQQQVHKVLRAAAVVSEGRLENVQSRYDVGESSKRELLPARVDLNADRSTVLRQEVTVQNAKSALNLLLARDAALDFTVEDTIIVDSGLDLPTLRTEALAANRHIRIADIDGKIAELELREVESGRWPRLGLNLGYNFSQAETETGLITSNRSNGLTYGVSASLNLFDGFNTNRGSENARIEITAAKIEREEIEKQVETELLQAHRNYRNRLDLMALERENLALAKENLDIALERFRVGSIIALELREAQNALVAAESRLLSAQYEAKLAETELLRLSGRLGL